MQELLYSMLVKAKEDDAALDKEYNKITKEYQFKRKYGDVTAPGRRLRPQAHRLG